MKTLFVLLISVLALNASADILPNETAEAQSLVASATIRQSYRYCVAGTLTCRELFLLNDKQTGHPIKSFYDTFVSAQRAVGATSYFMENQDGTFHLMVDDVLDGQIGITKVFVENSHLTLTFNASGFPTINHAKAIRVGTSRWLDLTTTMSDQQIVMSGTEYDSNDASYANPVNIVYLRVN